MDRKRDRGGWHAPWGSFVGRWHVAVTPAAMVRFVRHTASSDWTPLPSVCVCVPAKKDRERDSQNETHTVRALIQKPLYSRGKVPEFLWLPRFLVVLLGFPSGFPTYFRICVSVGVSVDRNLLVEHDRPHQGADEDREREGEITRWRQRLSRRPGPG